MSEFENSWNINVLINEVENLKTLVKTLEEEIKELKSYYQND